MAANDIQAVPAQNGGPMPGDGQDPQRGVLDFILQVVMMVCAFQFMSSVGSSFFGIGNTVANNGTMTSLNSTTSNITRKPVGADALKHSPAFAEKNYVLMWPYESEMSLDVVINEQPSLTIADYQKIKGKGGKHGKTLAFWEEEYLILSASKTANNTRKKNVTIPITSAFWNNQTSLFAHAFLKRKDPFEEKSQGKKKEGKNENLLYKTFNLTTFRTRKKERFERSLMEDESTPEQEAKKFADLHVSPDDKSVLGVAAKNLEEDVTLMYLKPSLTLQLVDDIPPHYPKSSLPQQMKNMIDFYDDEDENGYYPILSKSEFWMRQDDLLPVNETLQELYLEMSIYPMKMWKWQLMSQMEETWRVQDETGQSDGASDVMRTVLMDTNPWLLGITFVISLLHTIFDMLAFKNDISFFKGKKSMEGISLRSMIVNAAFQVIILLYLFDNDTSFMILMSNAAGLAIEFWKISKAINISVIGGKIQWEEDNSYKQTKTKEYDEIATNHLLFVTMPLVAGYGVYSLFHQKHKGWYSWILNTLVGFIYMFGFVMMTPQLFINYKLQSVAHLNWRTMSYKSINTFIDDLFAFVIKMPIMHRLACLRDDLVFFIFLYQRWAYRVDFTRVNEFGQCSAPSEDMIAENKIASSDGSEDKVRKRRGARDKSE